jgi:hypothetical protein
VTDLARRQRRFPISLIEFGLNRSRQELQIPQLFADSQV